MRIAFYAPLKSPRHDTPSGDRRVGELLMSALRAGGHRVELASEFRSLDLQGDARRQSDLRTQGTRIAGDLARRWIDGAKDERPELWFTYHLYYKAPDWLGPAASAALGIPYVIAEASFAPKRAGGPWAMGHEAAGAAIARADLVFVPTRHDIECLRPIVAEPQRLVHLPPFLDARPFREALRDRHAHRQRLARAHGLDLQLPWLVVVAMMREGDKLASYRELAAGLVRLADLPWQLVVAGDGPARGEVGALLENAAGGRVRFAGELHGDELARLVVAGDVFVWPAVNEAYGMAMLEAQAAGVPVVSSAARGVPEVVRDGETGMLAPAGDPQALAALARRLLLDPEMRRSMGRLASSWVSEERSIETAAGRIDAALARIVTRAGDR